VRGRCHFSTSLRRRLCFFVLLRTKFLSNLERASGFFGRCPAIEHLSEHGLRGAGAAQIAAHQTREEKLEITHEEMQEGHRSASATSTRTKRNTECWWRGERLRERIDNGPWQYAVGDVVRYTRGSEALGISAGEYGRVETVNEKENWVTVKCESGQRVRYDPPRLQG